MRESADGTPLQTDLVCFHSWYVWCEHMYERFIQPLL